MQGRQGSTMDCPEQLTQEVHMCWNIERRLWITNTVEFTKLSGTPTSNGLPRAPSFTVPCETGEGFEMVCAKAARRSSLRGTTSTGAAELPQGSLASPSC